MKIKDERLPGQMVGVSYVAYNTAADKAYIVGSDECTVLKI